MLSDAKKNGWLIFACLAILVLPFTASVAKPPATNLDFRGLEVGMTIEEINQLESVKLGYLPRLTQDEATGSRNTVICRPALIGVYISGVESQEFVYDIFSKAFDSEHQKYFPDSRNLAGPPGTLICDSAASEEPFVSRGPISFTDIKLTFWNGKLADFWLSFEGAVEELHKSLVEKYASLPTFEIIKETEKKGIREYETNTIIASSNPSNGLAAVVIKNGHLDLTTKNLDKTEAFEGTLWVADAILRQEVERIIANTFRVHTDAVVKKRTNERKKREQEEELNRKFFN